MKDMPHDLRLRPPAGSHLNGSVKSAAFSSEFLAETSFLGGLEGEIRRTERSKRPFILMLASDKGRSFADHTACQAVFRALARHTRSTDLRGWYKDGTTLAIVFTEVGIERVEQVVRLLESRIRGLLSANLSATQVGLIDLNFYVFPDGHHAKGERSQVEEMVSPQPVRQRERRSVALRCKRNIDIVGSVLALVVGAPVFVLIALAVKFTSPGPIFFRQQRVGEDGRQFTFLKFRSMRAANDPSIHREYVKNLIEGKEAGPSESGEKLYKIKNDPRITSIGSFLRRTSLDEIPQFINVLRGEMSLVGPRPPIPYEVELYQLWHRERLHGVKPGITGLWQVYGRSRTTFDEAVRMDVTYARSWTVWLDVKLLLLTPLAVLSGKGAH